MLGFPMFAQEVRFPPAIVSAGGSSNGCLTLLGEIFPAQHFVVNTQAVKWRCEENSDARRQLNSIQKRMKKIEEAQ